MLDGCLPGFQIERKTHHHWVRFEGRTFMDLPIGERGKQNPEIYAGHVKKLVRFFALDHDCVKRYLNIQL